MAATLGLELPRKAQVMESAFAQVTD